ncbi:hypothetical protein [Metabacillus niabensis]|uniref:hypothetical protein n=1 Tax=Metabacillus niabensis TaxID=324854 RepID=UPI001CFAAD82|nr:hypothetical protein [Metabacillus niabensis]
MNKNGEWIDFRRFYNLFLNSIEKVASTHILLLVISSTIDFQQSGQIDEQFLLLVRFELKESLELSEFKNTIKN